MLARELRADGLVAELAADVLRLLGGGRPHAGA